MKYEVTIAWKKGGIQSIPMITGVRVDEGCVLLTSEIEGAPFYSKVIPLHAVDAVDVQEQVYRS